MSRLAWPRCRAGRRLTPVPRKVLRQAAPIQFAAALPAMISGAEPGYEATRFINPCQNCCPILQFRCAIINRFLVPFHQLNITYIVKVVPDSEKEKFELTNVALNFSSTFAPRRKKQILDFEEPLRHSGWRWIRFGEPGHFPKRRRRHLVIQENGEHRASQKEH